MSYSDQADGLRRLLTKGRPRMVGLIGMSRAVGTTTVVMNLAAELARRGEQVLVLDEHAGHPGSVCDRWGLKPAGSLQAVAARHVALAEAAAVARCGVKVLEAGAQPSCGNARALLASGVILVDVALQPGGELSALARTVDDLVIVLQPTPLSITAAYAGLKALHFTHALQHFKFLVNEAESARQAQLVIANFIEAGRRHLPASLVSMGWIGRDPHVGEAERLKSTISETCPTGEPVQTFRRLAALIAQGHAPAAAQPPARPSHPAGCAWSAAST